MHTHSEHPSFTQLSIKKKKKQMGKLKINIDFDNNANGITFTHSKKRIWNERDCQHNIKNNGREERKSTDM